MISVLIISESRYLVSRDKIRQAIKSLLVSERLNDVEVSISIVGARKIRKLNRQWRQIDKETDVLSFPLEEARDISGTLRLGDIVVCYPVAIKQAQTENKLVDDKINELVEHGLRHLLGQHHEE
jgi:probable rRNA maturation factor